MGSELYRYRNIGEITTPIKALNCAVGKPENRAIVIRQTAVFTRGQTLGDRFHAGEHGLICGIAPKKQDRPTNWRRQ
jgi:hypothetical protein